MAVADEHAELVLALHHTLLVAEGLLEQVRRLRMVIEGELRASDEDLAVLRAEEAKWREQVEGLRRRLASFAVSATERVQ